MREERIDIVAAHDRQMKTVERAAVGTPIRDHIDSDVEDQVVYDNVLKWRQLQQTFELSRRPPSKRGIEPATHSKTFQCHRSF